MSSGIFESESRDHRAKLDAHLRDMLQWHFSPETGCPFWLEWAEKAGWDPREKVRGVDDLKQFGLLQIIR